MVRITSRLQVKSLSCRLTNHRFILFFFAELIHVLLCNLEEYTVCVNILFEGYDIDKDNKRNAKFLSIFFGDAKCERYYFFARAGFAIYI